MSAWWYGFARWWATVNPLTPPTPIAYSIVFIDGSRIEYTAPPGVRPYLDVAGTLTFSVAIDTLGRRQQVGCFLGVRWFTVAVAVRPS